MAEPPQMHSGEQEFIGCPFCTIQIPVEAVICPHCQKILPPSEKLTGAYDPEPSGISGLRQRLFPGDRFPGLSDFWILYGRWIKVAGPVLAAVALLFLVYGVWVDYKVTIVPNPQLPIRVKKDKRENIDLLTVFVTNQGEDVPDLSLKSIGVVVDFAYRDGRREKKTVFPKAEHRGEGAMLNGETGLYEVAIPSKGLKEIVLRSEVVDLGMGRRLIPSGSGRR